MATKKSLNVQIFETLKDNKENYILIPIIDKEGNKEIYFVNKAFIHPDDNQKEEALKIAKRSLNKAWEIDFENFEDRMNEWEADFNHYKALAFPEIKERLNIIKPLISTLKDNINFIKEYAATKKEVAQLEKLLN